MPVAPQRFEGSVGGLTGALALANAPSSRADASVCVRAHGVQELFEEIDGDLIIYPNAFIDFSRTLGIQINRLFDIRGAGNFANVTRILGTIRFTGSRMDAWTPTVYNFAYPSVNQSNLVEFINPDTQIGQRRVPRRRHRHGTLG